NVFTRRGTERIIRAAFENCVRRNKKNKVTSVTKSNAQAFGMVFWDEVFQEVAAQYPRPAIAGHIDGYDPLRVEDWR
ncbi:MAG: hypothetical protein IH969_08825, partial [Candidatus Krumholzibacteriota bacterium]|nr:hypothetical protein [Candidatus Krumholzibacteriota bacterium]